jgi:rare lipoprotein A
MTLSAIADVSPIPTQRHKVRLTDSVRAREDSEIMNATARIYTLTSALVLMAFGGWGISTAAVASDGSASSAGESTATGEASVGGSPVAEGTPSLSETPSQSEAPSLSEAAMGQPSGARSLERVRRLSPDAKLSLDRSGRKRIGKASFYAKMFAGRTMADGTRMEPTGDNAASLTLPLGTTAKVTNLKTGKTAVVTIRDRGPYVAGRIVDLSPATAQEIGLDKRTGVTKVEVAPIAVPLANGEIKLGDSVLEASNLPDGRDSVGTGDRTEARASQD